MLPHVIAAITADNAEESHKDRRTFPKTRIKKPPYNLFLCTPQESDKHLGNKYDTRYLVSVHLENGNFYLYSFDIVNSVLSTMQAEAYRNKIEYVEWDMKDKGISQFDVTYVGIWYSHPKNKSQP